MEAQNAEPREKAYRLSFGHGLLLEVQPSGAKTWLYRYQHNGKRRDMGLGPLSEVSISAARKAIKAAQAIRETGADPISARRADQREVAQKVEEAAAPLTFRDVAEKLVAAQSPGWSSEKTTASWRLTLDRHAYPAIGDVPVAEIASEHVVRTLSAIWTAQPATARKLQRRISAVLDYATAHGLRTAPNPAAGRVLRLTQALPNVKGKGKRWASLPWQKVPAFLAALDKQTGMAPLALRFAVLTAVRSNEVRQAHWSEIDVGNALWTIPGHRMKGGGAKDLPPHRVPLSRAMLEILCRAVAMRTGEVPTIAQLGAVAALQGDALIFTNPKGEAFSDAALGACIKRLNEGAKPGAEPWRDVDGRPVTAHGFRRSFRTWVDDEHPTERAAAERALAHEGNDKVEEAYRGSDLLPRRRPLMEAWGEFCSKPPAPVKRLRPVAKSAG
ncbi:tyrosine-type recombinase/integrase [Neoroseomonas oryzicola]|uniref:Integrase arm-type DNA-binding domain-containing protein n=1 Tax=Neoroseomonas oryzicola TaxID=535904 RepID=A0A9X9WLW8_9PROT|nr:integrase arm-type DNA-binding domain-containing protein [Neoroseomonas oryzicola]MBR0661328.1 integrase arm-type DNA-binding domain-containing protein [Neoroseomonas oryzicola]NKE18818.1 integrase arm-type DNA-binding domain-containing protein [Neoroseomonas oryzicola]